MFCHNCGNRVSSKANFCKNCGAKLSSNMKSGEEENFYNNKKKLFKDFFKIRKFVSNNIDSIKKEGFYQDVNKDDLDRAIEEINRTIFKYLDGVKNIDEYFYSTATSYCIEKFVDAEMDYTTPGVRGLGRMSTFTPRFGGFYSGTLEQLSNGELEIIRDTISNIVNYGYYTFVLFDAVINDSPKKLNTIDNELLFHKWIPEIYASNFPEDSNLESFLNQSYWDAVFYFCLKITDSTNFPKKILSLRNAYKSKLAMIISRYIDGGFLLRLLETKQ